VQSDENLHEVSEVVKAVSYETLHFPVNRSAGGVVRPSIIMSRSSGEKVPKTSASRRR